MHGVQVVTLTRTIVLLLVLAECAILRPPKPSDMSGERQSGEDRWREFSNSFKARSAAESSAAEQSRSLSVRPPLLSRFLLQVYRGLARGKLPDAFWVKDKHSRSG